MYSKYIHYSVSLSLPVPCPFNSINGQSRESRERSQRRLSQNILLCFLPKRLCNIPISSIAHNLSALMVRSSTLCSPLYRGGVRSDRVNWWRTPFVPSDLNTPQIVATHKLRIDRAKIYLQHMSTNGRGPYKREGAYKGVEAHIKG